MREEPKVSMWAEAKAWFAREAWPVIFSGTVIAIRGAVALLAIWLFAFGVSCAGEVGSTLLKRVSSAIVEAVEPKQAPTPDYSITNGFIFTEPPEPTTRRTDVLSDYPVDVIRCGDVETELPIRQYGGFAYDAQRGVETCFVVSGVRVSVTQATGATVIIFNRGGQ